MRKKLRLDVERLAVDSFEADAGTAKQAGTVRAAQQQVEDGGGTCTYWRTCDCWTAYYRCQYFDFTEYSCDYDTMGPRVTADC
jgi:hypothetical protein